MHFESITLVASPPTYHPSYFRFQNPLNVKLRGRPQTLLESENVKLAIIMSHFSGRRRRPRDLEWIMSIFDFFG